MTEFRVPPMNRTDLLALDPSATPVAPMRPMLRLDTRDGDLDTVLLHESEDALPEAVYHRFVLRWNIPVTTDAKRLAASINAGELDSLLNRIIAGSDMVWDGQNHVNRMTDDAQVASLVIDEWCANWSETLPDGSGLWEAGDWFSDGVNGLPADSTDAELQAMANQLDAEALADCVVLAGTYRYLCECREKLR